MKRYQKKGFSANLSQPEIVSQKGMTIQSELKLDLLKYRIGLLKIAYESMCDFFPSYENDDFGLQISDILMNARYEDVNKFVNIGNGFENIEIFDIFKEFQVDFTNKHLVFFIFCEKKTSSSAGGSESFSYTQKKEPSNIYSATAKKHYEYQEVQYG